MIRVILSCCALCGLLSMRDASATDFPLQEGDVLEMTVVGVPALARRAVVDGKGNVSLPMFGDVSTSDRTLAEVRTSLRDRLSGEIHRSRRETGEELIVTVAPADLLLDLVQTRPVYVTGDVADPGERPFRPGLTVRQAVALAGGYDVMRLRKTDPFLESEDMRSEYVVLWTQYAAGEAAVRRLESALAGKPSMSMDLPDVPVDEGTLENIFSSERDLLGLSLGDLAKDRDHLDRSVAQTERQIATLTEQNGIQAEEIGAAKAELASLQGLLDRGLVQAPRVTEARRAILLSSNLQLETMVELRRADIQRDDLVRQRERLETQRRGALLQELTEVRLAVDATKAKLRAVGQKLAYVDLVRSQLVRGAASGPVVIVHRRGPDGFVTGLASQEDTVLAPGDVVDVTLDLTGEGALH